jgi:hypothetical protein
MYYGGYTVVFFNILTIDKMLTGILLCLGSMIGTWTLPFLLARFICCNLNKISGQKMQQFLKTVTWASVWNNDEPEGFVVGRWYIGYVFENHGPRGEVTNKMWLFCSRRFYNIHIAKTENLTSKKDTIRECASRNAKQIQICELDGNAVWNLHFTTRNIPVTELEPRTQQQNAISTIMEVYKKSSYAVALLYGEPGKGKSMISHFLAKALLGMKDITKVTLVDTFFPFQPGNQFNTLYTKVLPCMDSPLIIVVEEVDIGLSQMHNGTLIMHRDVPTMLSNKTAWSLFFDRFDRKQYPWVYFIMTTNKNASYFDELDASYMRTGRVNLKIQI